MKKKILILANSDVGLYKFRKELIYELTKNFEVYISSPEGDYIDKIEQLGCSYIETKIDRRGKNPFKDFRLLTEYSKIYDKINPDIVLSFTIKPNIYGGIISRLKNKLFIPNITGLGSGVEKRGFARYFIKKMYKASLNYAAVIFVQNNENAKFLVNLGLDRDKIKLIPGSGVNLKQYTVKEYPNDNIIKFLFISRVMKEKGIELYLETARYIKCKYPNTEFHILGFCEEDYEVILKKLQNSHIIIYHGMQSDISNFLDSSHCTIHPTYYPEGMSNVLLETAASGRPIITTNRSGTKEIVEDGISGFLVSAQNLGELINRVEYFIQLSNEEKKIMGLEGRKKVEAEFNREIVIKSYLNEIQNILIV